jgi:LacI family transcriptional regulator
MPEFYQDSHYWQMPAIGIQKAQQELESHRTKIRFFHFNRHSHDSFSRACDDVLSSDIDGLLIAPVLSTPAEEFVKKLPQNLPYVFFDSTVPQSNCLSSIVQDSFLSGRLAGRLMHLLVGNIGTIAAIRVLPEDFHIDERIKGFQGYFSQFPQLSLRTYDAVCHGNQNHFSELIVQILQEIKDLNGIFVSNALTYCIARALEESQVETNIHIVGYDLLQENIAYLKKGNIAFLISQQSERQGYQGIYTLFRRIVLNEPVPPKIMMPIDIITRENVDYYIGGESQ